MANEFGGQWTRDKISVFMKYAWAYLEIMKNQPFRLLYFDGFAGSGAIMQGGNELDLVRSVAIEILSLDHPKEFDLYYFVEKKEEYADSLRQMIATEFADKVSRSPVVQGDCNAKLADMTEFLRRPVNRDFRTLALIDPYGMQVNWASIERLKGLGLDMWILVPTGIGVTRLLKGDANIQESWMRRLTTFLGLTEQEVLDAFYKKRETPTLFGEMESEMIKEAKIVEKAAALYRSRLSTVFDYVSEPLKMKNLKNSVMYHFMLCSNNPVGLKIANDIVKPRLK